MQRGAGRRQAQALAFAGEQRQADAVFQQADLLADRARGDVQRLGRGLDAAALADFDEGAQGLKRDGGYRV